jgi:hypothetical protein
MAAELCRRPRIIAAKGRRQGLGRAEFVMR